MNFDNQLSHNLRMFDMLYNIKRNYIFWTNYPRKNVEYENYSVVSGTHTFYVNQFLQSQKLKKINMKSFLKITIN